MPSELFGGEKITENLYLNQTKMIKKLQANIANNHILECLDGK